VQNRPTGVAMTAALFTLAKWLPVAWVIASIAYVHRRGRVRHAFWRQLSDHSTLLAPVNALMYLCSRVPLTPYIDPRAFRDLDTLRVNWKMIREEALAVQTAGSIRASERYDDVGFNSFFKTGWRRFYLKWYDDCHPSARELCPRTVELLRGLPTVKAAMFAELPPGSRLVRHRDPYAGSLRYHLGLVTPTVEGCSIWVDGEKYSWREGEDVVFDETFIHYAENTTDQDRIVLFCDLERPLRYRWAETLNHFIARHIMAAATSPNRATDRTGVINRLFPYVYAVRLVGKRLKKRSRVAYYAVKWALYGGLLALVVALLLR